VPYSSRRLHRRLAAIGLLVAGLVNAPGAARPEAASPDSAPPLPAPTGTVIDVSTVAQLQAAVANIQSNTTIRLAPGTYVLTSTLYINRNVSDIAIRGASNNRNDVVLKGPGMANASYGSVPHGIWTGGGVTRVTIANLTIRDVYFHPLIFNGGTQQPRVYNVRLLDGGEQLLKSNPDGAGGGVDGGVVEYSVFEYTTVARSDYTNGVDVHTGDNWVIRHNLFRRIRASAGLAGPAILMWNDSRHTLVDGNTFVDNHRDISLGLITRSPNDHTGGIVRNNMIVRTSGAGGDVGIAVFDSPGTTVVHNTLWLNGQYPNAVEYRFPDTAGTVITNNLTDAAIVARDGAAGALSGNVTSATAADFMAPASGNLHLTAAATRAIDKVAAPASALSDWDGEARPTGALADVGADERGVAPPTEICGDGIDNDGDGVVDEGCIEVCGDGIDNDGDGQVDEGCPPSSPEICGDGIDNDGDGLVDEGCAGTPAPGPPGVPARLAGSVQGRTVSLSWLAPIAGGTLDRYVLEAGLAAGTTIVRVPLGAQPSATLPGVGAGTYFLRVRAEGPGGAGPVSNEVAVTVGPCARTSAPKALSVAANGPRVTLTWKDDAACGGRPYALLVGTGAGTSDLGQVPVGGSPLELVVPPGAFFVRVAGPSGTASNEVRLTGAGACTAPSFTLVLSGRVTGGRVVFDWTPADRAVAEAADAATPVSYVLEAGLTPGGAEFGAVPLGRTTSFAVPAPPGRYHVRVRPQNACGLGPASNDAVVTVP
jgi:hypothetical protein